MLDGSRWANLVVLDGCCRVNLAAPTSASEQTIPTTQNRLSRSNARRTEVPKTRRSPSSSFAPRFDATRTLEPTEKPDRKLTRTLPQGTMLQWQQFPPCLQHFQQREHRWQNTKAAPSWHTTKGGRSRQHAATPQLRSARAISAPRQSAQSVSAPQPQNAQAQNSQSKPPRENTEFISFFAQAL